jgi:[amino group carrier protein]-L-2-aminoadipate 6-kinase
MATADGGDLMADRGKEGNVPAGVIVIKCGGGGEIGLDEIAMDVAKLRAAGERVVVVHGGARDIDRLAGQLGVTRETTVSPEGLESRYTSPAMLDALLLAMTGRAKPRLLAALAAAGVPAVGLTGLDAGMITAVRKKARRAVRGGRTVVVRGDHSGRITRVDPEVLRVLLDAGFTPVLSPPAGDGGGQPLNVDADRLAAAVAAALGARCLVLLTAAPGLLREAADERSLVPRCEWPDEALLAHAASGGMHRKLIAADEALRAGVPQVRIADGRAPAPVAAALDGAGTLLIPSRRTGL